MGSIVGKEMLLLANFMVFSYFWQNNEIKKLQMYGELSFCNKIMF